MSATGPFTLVAVGAVRANADLLQAVNERARAWLGRETMWHGLEESNGAERRAWLGQADALLWLPGEDEDTGRTCVRDALALDCPVIAAADERAEAFLDQAGLILQEPTADNVAPLLAAVDALPELRRRLIRAQRARYAALAPGAPRPLAFSIEGPWRGSYSLAVVNRRLGGALEAAGLPCALYDRRRGARGPAPAAQVALANDWPPEVDGLRGETCALAAYAWEETAFPAAGLARFNARLNLVTTASDHVTRILQDNGLTVPVETIGLGTEHALEVTAEAMPVEPGEGFCFLHVSTGLPRKGLDVLLRAWAEAFDDSDPVRLIVKTTPNPHNDAAAQVDALRNHPGAAPVELYDADWSDGAMRSLYESCHALVAPSRGEGFGLPLAEAMHHGLAVITTAWGGQRAFCTDETAWLVNYRFVPAQSHLSVPGSAWAEPDPGHVAQRLREVFQASEAERRARSEMGATLLRRDFTWPAVARRLQEAVARHGRAALVPPRLRLAWISTWNSRCGIAEYSRRQLESMADVDPVVLANSDADPVAANEPWVRRCWRTDETDGVAGLADAAAGARPDAAVIQFHFGLMTLSALGDLLMALRDRGIPAVAVLHATRDGGGEHIGIYRDKLAAAARLILHSVPELEAARQAGLAATTVVIPHGVDVPRQPLPAPAGAAVLDEGPVLACFGFLLPEKGVAELIQAFGRIQAERPEVRLLLLTAQGTGRTPAREYERCTALINALPDPERVKFITRFLSHQEVLAWLQRATLAVFPYQYSRESASGAVRMALAADCPVACTPLPVFDDLGEAVHRLPGTQVADLAQGIADLLADEALRRARDEARRRWLEECSWPQVAARLRGLLYQLCTGAAEGRRE